MTSQIFRVVFEDSSLVVVEKLRPFLSQRADRSASGEGLFEFVARAIKQALYPVHRLDREVLGLMIFAKTSSAAEDLSLQFKNRVVQKGYEAVVRGRVAKDEDRIEHFLKKNERNNHVTVFVRPTPGAKNAILRYRVLERFDDRTRLWIDLETGRSHQIRAQLAKIGHPIVGDSRYGAGAAASSVPRRRRSQESEPVSIQLRSQFLSVLHPVTKERMQWQLGTSDKA